MQTPYVLEGLSVVVSVLMSEKRILRSLCYLPVARGQQTAHDTVQNRRESIQERLYVRVPRHFKPPSKTDDLLRIDGMNG